MFPIKIQCSHEKNFNYQKFVIFCDQENYIKTAVIRFEHVK
jgi:hypothetical protein